MKHTNIKAMLLCTTVIALGFVSCNSGNKPEDSKEMAEEKNDAKFENKNSEQDAAFVVAAEEINLKEIELGKLAEMKGMMAGVKDLGKMMVEAHTKSHEELKALAAGKSISVPPTVTDNGKEAYDKLVEKSGTDFDKDYADMMVDGHQDAIKKFEDASNNCTDPEIKAWAAKMLPDLRSHLEHAMTVKDQVAAAKDMKKGK